MYICRSVRYVQAEDCNTRLHETHDSGIYIYIYIYIIYIYIYIYIYAHTLYVYYDVGRLLHKM